MSLSDVAVRSAKPAAKQFKLFDDGGLFLIVRPSGGKLWRFKYRHAGKEQQLSLGSYPDVGLKEARARRDEARKVVSRGANPAFEKKRAAAAAAISAANTFQLVGEEFVKKREAEGVAEITATKMRWLLAEMMADLGNRPIAEIEPYELLAVLRRVELSGRRETAGRMLSFSGRVFRFAIATTRARRDIGLPLRGDPVSMLVHRGL